MEKIFCLNCYSQKFISFHFFGGGNVFNQHGDLWRIFTETGVRNKEFQNWLLPNEGDLFN